MRIYQISASSADAARQIAETVFRRDTGNKAIEVTFISGPSAETQLPFASENTGGTWEIIVN